MPVHETYESEERAKKPMVFFKVVEGKYIDDNGRAVAAIEGTWESVRIEHDPGNEKARVKPYDAVVCYISDDENVFRLKFHSNIVFAGSFAGQLKSINRGDKVRVGIRPGDKSDKVSFCDLRKWDGEEFKKVDWETLPPTEEDRTRKVIEIINNHPSAPKQKE